MDDVIKAFLVSIGFAADESSARKTEERIKGVEDTARKSDQARTKLSGEAAMERARQALKEAGIHNASIAQIMAKRDEMAKADKEHEKRQKEYEARQAKARANTIAGMRTLANTAAATAVAIQGFTVALSGYAMHVAAKLEEMAYSSDRTKSSVQDLKVFSMAVSQLGGSAGGALNDLENFAGRLRSNPQGYAAFLKSVGVEARDAQGNIRGAADLYKEFRKNVGERKPYEQQLLYAQEMGISEQTWRATDPAKLAEEEARSRAKYARLGYDPDKAAEDAKQLQRVLRDMFESINIIGEKTASKIFKDLGGNLREFTTFVEQHGDQIAEILSKVAQVVLEVSKALLQILTSPEVKQGFDWLLGMFGHVEEGTGKWIADTEKIKDALEALAVFVATIFVAKITGAFATILKELGPLLVRLAPLLALMGIAGYANSNGVLTGPEGSRSLGEGALRTLDPGLADRVYGKTEGDRAADAKDDRTWWQRNMPKALGGKDAPAGGSKDGSRSWRNNNPGNIKAGRFADSMGATGQDSAGFARFPSYEAGRKAQESLLFESDGYKNKTIKDAIARWAPASDGNDPAGYAAQMAKAAGVDVNTRMSDLTPEQRSKFLNAQQAKEGWIPGATVARQVAGNTPPVNGVGGLEQNQGSAEHRKEALSDALQKQLVAAAKEAGVNVDTFSGGQDPDHQYGSTRHNHGNAADVRLYRMEEDGRRRYLDQRNEADRKVMESFLRSAVKNGATGIGAGPGYMGPEKMHVGGGSVRAWGAGGSSAAAPEWVKRALQQGLEDRASITAAESAKPAGQAAKAPASAPAPAAPTVLPKLQEAARTLSEKAADTTSRLDQSKLRTIGAATEGFNPSEYFKSAPPVGTTNTSNDNSVRHQSYNRGDTNVNIYTQADARETHDLWKRHEDRQKADDLRHASNIFAA